MNIQKRLRAIGYLEAGKSTPEAAEHFNVDESSIKRLKRKFRETRQTDQAKVVKESYPRNNGDQ